MVQSAARWLLLLLLPATLAWNLPLALPRTKPPSTAPIDYAVDVPYAEAAYDPEAADAFFKARPIAALRRLFQIASLSGGFIAKAILDRKLGREDRMVEQRSKELLEVVTKLGPTFIKVGQALSIRTDLLPAPYVAGLVELQDSVAPFPAAQGRAVIERELEASMDATFAFISAEPVAAASIGQVCNRAAHTVPAHPHCIRVRAHLTLTSLCHAPCV